MTGDSNDRASICDEFINPLYASVPGCTDAARGVGDSWSVPFDGAGGVAMSAVMGYRLHGMVRAEVEYVMRSSNYSQRSGVLAAQGVNADKLSDELFLAQGRELEADPDWRRDRIRRWIRDPRHLEAGLGRDVPQLAPFTEFLPDLPERGRGGAG